MKTILFSLTLLMAGTIFGQTKLISHKSHSGSLHTFSVLSECNLGIVYREYELENKLPKELKKTPTIDSTTLVSPIDSSKTQIIDESENLEHNSQQSTSSGNLVPKNVVPLKPEQQVESEQKKKETPSANPPVKIKKEGTVKQGKKASTNPFAVILMLSIILGPSMIYLFRTLRSR